MEFKYWKTQSVAEERAVEPLEIPVPEEEIVEIGAAVNTETISVTGTETDAEPNAEINAESTEIVAVPVREEGTEVVDFAEERRVREEKKQYEREVDEFFDNGGSDGEDSVSEGTASGGRASWVRYVWGTPLLILSFLLSGAFIAVFFAVLLVLFVALAASLTASVLVLTGGIGMIPAQVPSGLIFIGFFFILLAVSMLIVILALLIVQYLIPGTGRLAMKIKKKLNLFN